VIRLFPRQNIQQIPRSRDMMDLFASRYDRSAANTPDSSACEET
jgi:hypothetical protein